MAQAGLIAVSTVMGVASLACTMLPASTWRKPTRPSIGAVMVAKLSCVSALSMPAWSASMVALEIVHLGLLLIDRLLGAGALAHQVLEAVEVLLIGDELGLVLGTFGLGLIQRGGERALIDNGERVALLDLLAFDEIHAGELAVDLAADGDGVGRLHRAEAIENDRHVAG